MMNERVVNPVEMLNDLACCFSQERLSPSQVAVLTTIARFPGSSSGVVVNKTGQSEPNVRRILSFLRGVGDVMFVASDRRNPGKRRYYVTMQGAKLITRVCSHMQWDDRCRFGVVAIRIKQEEGAIYKL